MKISVGMLVVNGRPFIKAQLENLYEIAHEIIIAEGGDKFWRARHRFTRSNDGTIEIIKNFPDPQNKIKLIQQEWTDKNQMSRAYSKGMTGDIIYNVDLDEFLSPKDLRTVCKKLLKSKFDSAQIPHYVFFGDFNTLMAMEHTDTWVQVPRIFKRGQGDLLMNHLPPGYVRPKGGVVGGSTMSKGNFPGIYIHHYSWIYPKAVHDKIAYYAHRIKGCIKPEFLGMFDGFQQNKQQLIKNKTDIRPTAGAKQFLKPYKGKPLEAVVKSIKADMVKL